MQTARYLIEGAAMRIMRPAVVNEAEIARRVKAVERKLKPDVVRIRHDVTLNSTDQESIFFRIVLSDDASRESRLREVTERIEARLEKAIPFDDFGLYLYFLYRNRSEQAEMKEPSWA
ncbi:MAG: hypothetical protein ABSH50_13075 [Bryobacteraceae bacterium]|jgi:hypothetical protein